MSVRVVAKVRCERCGGNGTIADPGNMYWGTTNGHCKCPNCRGTGTVERECRCDGCTHYIPKQSMSGTCRWFEAHTYADHACKAWEPRE